MQMQVIIELRSERSARVKALDTFSVEKRLG